MAFYRTSLLGENMDELKNSMIAVIFMTRRCNMDCSYCKIKDNHFPNELNTEQWKIAFWILKHELQVPFVGLLGGELLLRRDIVELIKYLHEIDLPYAICTNAEDKMMTHLAPKLLEAQVRNISVSIDTLDISNTDDINVKSQDGLKWLEYFKSQGVPDLHLTIVITRKNISNVPDIIKRLGKKYWIEITGLDTAKDDSYDFSGYASEMPDLIFHKKDKALIKKIFREIRELKQSGEYMIHTNQIVLDETEKHLINADWKCQTFSNLAIDADGTVRLCLRRNPFKRFNILDFENAGIREEFTRTWYEYVKDCKGCLYDCQIQSEYQLKCNGKEKGKEAFIHSEKGDYK